MDNLKNLVAIFYVFRTGIQWKALPRCLTASGKRDSRPTTRRKESTRNADTGWTVGWPRLRCGGERCTGRSPDDRAKPAPKGAFSPAGSEC